MEQDTLAQERINEGWMRIGRKEAYLRLQTKIYGMAGMAGIDTGTLLKVGEEIKKMFQKEDAAHE